MTTQTNVLLAPFTTLQLGGPADELVTVTSHHELCAAVQDADNRNIPVLLLGGGSNVVVADDGWPGRVVLIRPQGISVQHDGDVVVLDVAAGEPWDAFVQRCTVEGWSGIECLSGIPGLAGATPVQNVGAYGQEVADVVASVLVWDRERNEQRTMPAADCGFSYRHSIFKHNSRYVVLSVQFRLSAHNVSQPIKFPELARSLGLSTGDTAPLVEVRQAVLGLRKRKGMVLDCGDHDTWSVGSFFLNPIIDQAEFDRLSSQLESNVDCPHWPVDDGRIKLSAGWLINQAGFSQGYQLDAGSKISLSTKHSLAITNRGGGSAKEVVELARSICDVVREKFGVVLTPEPRLVGVAL